MTDKPICEYLMGMEQFQPLHCGAPAVWRYPAMGGGYMHLCERHVGKITACERIPDPPALVLPGQETDEK